MSPKEEVEMLMNELILFAKQMLAEAGEFYPYGGFINAAGKIVHVGVEKENNYPSSSELLNDLQAEFCRMALADECVATGIVVNVTITPPNQEDDCDAIRVTVDHKGGYSAHVFFPYAITDNGVEYYNVFAKQGENTSFKHASADKETEEGDGVRSKHSTLPTNPPPRGAAGSGGSEH